MVKLSRRLFFKKLSPLLKNERGEIMVKSMLFLLLIVIVILFSIEVLGIAIKYQNVNYCAKSLAKIIECDGQVTNRVDKQLDELNNSFNMNMTYEVTNVKYVNVIQKNIQFRDSFKVIVKDKVTLKILNPIFTPPVEITLNLKADIPGMSEVYWK